LIKGGRPKKAVSLTWFIFLLISNKRCVQEKTGLRGRPRKALTTQKCDQLAKHTVNPIVASAKQRLKENIPPGEHVVSNNKRTRSQTKAYGELTLWVQFILLYEHLLCSEMVDGCVEGEYLAKRRRIT